MATGCRTCSILKGYFLKADMWACFIGMCPPSMCRPLQRKWIWFKNIPTADDSRCSHAIDNVWTGCALVFTHTISQTFWWNVAIMNSSPKIRLNTIFSPFSQILMLILMVQAFCLLQPLHTSILLETFSPCSAPMEMYPPRPMCFQHALHVCRGAPVFVLYSVCMAAGFGVTLQVAITSAGCWHTGLMLCSVVC